MNGPILDRRAFVVGAATLPLVACEPPSEEIMETVAKAAAILSLFATGGGAVGAVFGMARLVRIAERAGSIAGFLERFGQFMPIYRALYAATSASSESPPADAGPASIVAKPRPVVPANYVVNNPESVTFFTGSADVMLGGRNDSGADFEVHNVFGILQPIEWGAPVSAEQVMGPAGLASFAMALPSGQSHRERIPVTLPSNQGYVLYSWCLPAQYELTDAVVRERAMVGPVIYGCDPYDEAALAAIRDERDPEYVAEAQYQVEDVTPA
jgi:hypothetical protein